MSGTRTTTVCIKLFAGTYRKCLKKAEGGKQAGCLEWCGALSPIYMEKNGNKTKAAAATGMADTTAKVEAMETCTEGKKPVRLTHHTERVPFPSDGKKAKAYFQALENGYARCWCVGRKDTYQAELAYYKKRYGNMVKARNEAYAKDRHADRVTGILDLYGRKRTCPEELTIQVGGKNGGGVPDREVFNGCIMQYLSWMQEWGREHGDCLHILDAYVSKKPPYRAIIRRVWDCLGKGGFRIVTMTGALKAAGIPCPDEGEEESRFNNRKMTFDRMSREVLYKCFEDAGIPINRKPRIYTLRKAMEIKEKMDAEEQYARDMLREIIEVEAQAPPIEMEADIPGMQESPDGHILIPEESYRLLKIRECLAGAYASRNQTADKRLLDALDKEREAQEAGAAQCGIRAVMELEYTVLRIGLLRCGYYIGVQEGGGMDEGVPQQFKEAGLCEP